ncbi:MAG: MFS transporter [Candidatus Binataceae bacterium]|nr:MFS transporter [Candidatus Binataceae bacterium]
MADSSAAHSGGLKGYFAANRTLETYPTGARRWGMLLLTVMATVISFYEFGFSALLPLWLPALHFSREDFGWFLTAVVFLSGFSAMYGGPLADRHGRVVVIDACLAVMILLTFANLLMTGFWSFVIVRGLMNLVAGLSWGALGGLTRDMSPRVSRGAAFGLLTLGAVACLWLWNEVPAWTLPIFHTWQSQIWIMGILAIALYIPVLLFLKDLAPGLRMMVIDSEHTGAAYEGGAIEAVPEVPGSALGAFHQLLSRWESWVIVIGAVAFLTTAITIQTFGPLMFTEAYHYKPAQAASVAANFWLANLVMLVPAGIFSDWLRVRKPVTIVLACVALIMLLWWVRNFFPPLSPAGLGLITLTLGAVLASAYIPWCAFYSEFLEDLSPALQATGWSFFQMIYRTWVAFSGPLLLWVAAHYGWNTWMWATVFGAAIFVVSQLAVRGHWRPETAAAPVRGAPAHAAGG